jgi:hypothetical protein
MVALVCVEIGLIVSGNMLEDTEKNITDLLLRCIVQAWPASGRAFCQALDVVRR